MVKGRCQIAASLLLALSAPAAGQPPAPTLVVPFENLQADPRAQWLGEAAAVPLTAVGLNSRVEFTDLDTGERESHVLTLPAAADPDHARLSVLAPVGTALLGYREGDEIEWPTPGGIRRLKLLRVTRERGLTAPAAG